MISFGAPAVLAGLILLPAIWWLLRLTPPKPQAEVFPPFRLLARVFKREETPAQSPWWLTLLRLAMAALVIIALAAPLLNPRTQTATGDGPLLVMLDNGWAAADTFDTRVAQATALIEDARDRGNLVALTTSVAPQNATATLDEAGLALSALSAVEPVAARPDRVAALDRLTVALGERTDANLAILSDGLAQANDDVFFAALAGTPVAATSLYQDDGEAIPLVALSEAQNGAQTLDVSLIAAPGATAEGAIVSAYDESGRLLARAPAVNNAETGAVIASFADPFELRNDFAVLRIDDARHAGAVHLLDDSNRRRRVGLITGLAGDQDQPLLSPLFYIRRAIAPFTDILDARTGELATDLPEMIEQGPAMIVMADVGVIPDSAIDALNVWIDAGGTLVRFAGPRLAALSEEDPLLPVTLRLGERQLGGSLSWTEPQAVAPFPENSPFADLPAPVDVAVNRQILAEPDIDLNTKTWAVLEDGTPLVTGERRGRGAVVLFHVTAEATWSNLPISGTFVEMLQRIANSATNTGTVNASPVASAEGFALPPVRILRTDGELVPPPASVRPLDFAEEDRTRPDFENPAGFYGTSDAYSALNVVNADDTLAPIVVPAQNTTVTRLAYPADTQTNLAVWLFAAALLLLALDTLAVLWINGKLSLRGRAFTRGAAAAITGGVIGISIITTAPQAFAQDTPAEVTEIDEATAIELTETTRIAYVLTGVPGTDDTSRTGLDGLTRFIASRTALEPGEPVGVDLETDELAFFPLIYYPIDAGAALPSEAAIGRLDAYMQGGGTVLFDTRDQLTGALSSGGSPENRMLREILSGLNIPPLEPVPADHVLTKSFYILSDFPGRYAGSPLWVEATPELSESDPDRPVRSGDGVSPILITGNDFASAWALDEIGRPTAAVNSGDPMQRIYAFRSGVNIMMYMLTGNYKADQVHIPALLERLGQ